MTGMPSETITGAVGTIVGAALVIVGEYANTDIPTAVAGAIVTLISWLAYGITLVVKWRRSLKRAAAQDDSST